MRQYEDMKGIDAMNITFLCCGGWLVVLIFALCLLTVGKWADENLLEAQKRDKDFEDVPDDADIF